MNSWMVVGIGLPLVFVGVAFLIVWRETRRIHEVVNSRLTGALLKIEELRADLVEIRSTPESREQARKRYEDGR